LTAAPQVIERLTLLPAAPLTYCDANHRWKWRASQVQWRRGRIASEGRVRQAL